MINRLKKVFQQSQDRSEGAISAARDEDLRLATCALFLEIATIDDEFSPEERESIVSLLKERYRLPEEEVMELKQEARNELERNIDLWQFTNLINENYSEAEKIRVVEVLWRIVYSDGRLDKHEDFLIHKLAKLLRLRHHQLIEVKLKVLHGEENQNPREGGG